MFWPKLLELQEPTAQPGRGGDGLDRAVWSLFPVPSRLKTSPSSEPHPLHLGVEKRHSFSFKNIPREGGHRSLPPLARVATGRQGHENTPARCSESHRGDRGTETPPKDVHSRVIYHREDLWPTGCQPPPRPLVAPGRELLSSLFGLKVVPALQSPRAGLAVKPVNRKRMPNPRVGKDSGYILEERGSVEAKKEPDTDILVWGFLCICFHFVLFCFGRELLPRI